MGKRKLVGTDEVYDTRDAAEKRVCEFFAAYAARKRYNFWTDWHRFVVTDAREGRELCGVARKYLRAVAVPLLGGEEEGDEALEETGYHFYPDALLRKIAGRHMPWYRVNRIVRAGAANYRLVSVESE